MYFEPFVDYVDALRKWDGVSPKPRSVYEQALIQSRWALRDGDKNFVLVPGMKTLLKVVKNGERLSVIEMESISLEALSISFKESCVDGAQSWLDLCFYENGDSINYDSFYDSLPFKEGSDKTIRQYLDELQQLSSCLLQLLPHGAIIAVADAEAFQKPLRYLLQTQGVKVLFYETSIIHDEKPIEPALLNIELQTTCGPFTPRIGNTYRITCLEGQDFPLYAVPPEPFYRVTLDGESVSVLSYMIRFESDCFGNVTAFSTSSHNAEKVTPLF